MKSILSSVLCLLGFALFAQDESNLKTISAPEPQEQVYHIVEEMPEFPGGQDSLYSFIGKNVRYPEKLMKEKLQGVVYIQFIVEKDGSIGETKILRSPHELFSEESKRVVMLMPKWKNGKQGGKAVRVMFNLPIRFRL